MWERWSVARSKAGEGDSRTPLRCCVLDKTDKGHDVVFWLTPFRMTLPKDGTNSPETLSLKHDTRMEHYPRHHHASSF